jgi:hypothetical protein
VTTPKTTNLLLQGISQFEVDFVIPRTGADLSLGIDPFLLFKSRDPNLSKLHDWILEAFNHGIALLRQGQLTDAKAFFDFPEVREIGLGYAKKGRRGSGIGEYLSALITETLLGSSVLLERGIRHIEEMQLVSLGIGPDRISDISANLLKNYLIEYTQKQCELWKIPLRVGVPIHHILEYDDFEWVDRYVDLPISPYDDAPILFVPRRIVRALPWINYEDFFRMEFAVYLRAKTIRARAKKGRATVIDVSRNAKEEIVRVARTEVNRIDRYVSAKEATASEAQPSLHYLSTAAICPESEELKTKLRSIRPGNADATSYQRTVLEILNFLFNPELIDGELEVRTIDGTERRDIIFTNDSDKSFWSYLRTEHSGVFLMFETKNTEDLENLNFNQTATYLGDRLGRLGFIVTRSALGEPQKRKAFSIYNDSQPRKIILSVSDKDLEAMLDMKCHGKDPMRYIQKCYRSFRTSVQ